MTEDPRFISVAEEVSVKLGYELIQYVACGAFKETFEAKDSDGARFALKIMDPTKCDLCRNDRELESMRRCNHNGIARLLFSGDIQHSSGESFFYSVEEFFDGGSLGDRIKQQNLDVTSAIGYGRYLANAVAYLADLELVHRDIKPENIMFKAKNECPILVDFGLVRDLSKTSITQTWQPMGPCTPLYAAPEQLNNDKAMIDWRTDQFTLGVVIAFCITGEHPFSPIRGDAVGSILDSVAARHPVSGWFRDFAEKSGIGFLLKMMHPWPHRRYTRPMDMLSAFEEGG